MDWSEEAFIDFSDMEPDDVAKKQGQGLSIWTYFKDGKIGTKDGKRLRLIQVSDETASMFHDHLPFLHNKKDAEHWSGAIGNPVVCGLSWLGISKVQPEGEKEIDFIEFIKKHLKK
ncbi:hypothetical protein HOG48_00600 [Candidatus Peregrinibacteria bacterium]|jgi:hypothetical protein|nr:hypothetical protein [Candidatus Peregrinibacteria bacterium]